MLLIIALKTVKLISDYIYCSYKAKKNAIWHTNILSNMMTVQGIWSPLHGGKRREY
ncbi:Uncharacterised protein [Yersinia pekkanenii]|uniref:Uncharacterized protein n=1 Tax=Yersinia pekkanenii TaxID=1288385 RepID=A0ABP1ZPU2_9GAMM|nr:Uncharacterised protein [Yersinia pekkanenii]